MISPTQTRELIGSTAYDAAGDQVGKIDQLYLDDTTGEPTWVTVNTGMFGSSTSFAPLADASFDGGDLRLNYGKDLIKDAPRIEDDHHLEPSEETELYRHYGLANGPAAQGAPAGTDDTRRDVETGEGTSLTLGEERLRVGTETRETGRARLRKYVTTETETVDVPVRQEKLVVDRTPVEGRPAAPITDEEVVEEVTLREERPVVGKETVAVEEVHLGKETVTDTEQVSEQLRREHADVEGDQESPRH